MSSAPKLLKVILSFNDNMAGTVQYDGSSSDSIPIRGDVKQGCLSKNTELFFVIVQNATFLLAASLSHLSVIKHIFTPKLFGMFMSLLLPYAFRNPKRRSPFTKGVTVTLVHLAPNRYGSFDGCI